MSGRQAGSFRQTESTASAKPSTNPRPDTFADMPSGLAAKLAPDTMANQDHAYDHERAADAAGDPLATPPLGSAAIEQLLAVAEARAQELEPFAQEFARLSQVISLLRDPRGPQQIPHLGLFVEPAPAPTAGATFVPPARPEATVTADVILARPAFKGRRGSRAGRDGRAPQGSNKQLIMRTIAEQPGINARGIAEQTNLKRSVVNATLSRLKRQGEVLDRDGGLHVSPSARNVSVREANG